MADNNRPTIKKASLVLALTCIIFATVATILYKNHQIGSIGYSAPFVIGTVVAILSCAALQRLFCSLFGKGYFSFGCKVSPKTEAVSIGINTDNPKVLSQTDNTASAVSTIPSYLKEYETRMEELERAKKERRTAIVRTIHDYTTYIMAEFFTKEELETLHENIDALAYGQPELYKPIRSKEENPIKSPALRHFAWNIGERLDIPLIDRAKFIKEIFPHELGNATIEYLSKNLRDSVTSKIKIDVPENGDYQFDCMRNFADGKISSC